MANAKPQTIGTQTFDTQGAAVVFIQGILNRQKPRTPITGEDHAFVMELLKKHPKAVEKIGVGVKHFTVEPSKGGTQCFYITRSDDSRDDFSFTKCLKG